MNKQKGFTLIELLLVIAIISIIALIAIPAYLGQRSRTRDTVAVSNMNGRLGDLLGQYDKLNESGYTSADMIEELEKYLRNTVAGKDKNPWAGTANATASPFSYTVVAITGNSTKDAFETKLAERSPMLGRPEFIIQFATLETPGYLGGAVTVQNKDRHGKNVQTKSLVLE